ncbi:hypothetical protein BH10PSE18_BH10PSE18_23620 [soil metagenome]
MSILSSRHAVMMAVALAVMSGAASSGAQPAASTGAERSSGSPTVLTRARVNSFSAAPGGKFHLRLKLMPRAKLPFTTQTFTVADRALLAGISEGDWVKFAVQRIDGENTVTSLQVVAACQRFQPCD